MEAFRNLISFIRGTEDVDFIAELPLEIALLILKYLDDESFSASARVSRQWAEICRRSNRVRPGSKIKKSENVFRPVQWVSRRISADRLWEQKKGAIRVASHGISHLSPSGRPGNGHSRAGKCGGANLRL